MRTLKTPEEIILAASTSEGFDTQEEAFKALIIAAQRDALECAFEQACYDDINSILNLMP